MDPAEHEAVYDLRRKTTLNLAAALQRSGEHAAAIARLEKLLDEDPDDAKALWRRSVSFLATHEHAAARSDLSRCAEIDPSTAEEVRAQLRKVERREIEGAARGEPSRRRRWGESDAGMDEREVARRQGAFECRSNL